LRQLPRLPAVVQVADQQGHRSTGQHMAQQQRIVEAEHEAA